MITPSAENSIVLFLDLQDGIVMSSRTNAPDRLKRGAGALAKLVDLHGLPAFASAVPPGGALLDVLVKQIPTLQPRMRTFTTAFADEGLVGDLRASGRKILILAGVASEIVVQRTALDALAAGFDVHVAVDVCGGVDSRSEEAAWRRIVQAGGVTSSVAAFAAELAGDFSTRRGGETLSVIFGLLSA